MRILAIDPGPEESGFVVWDGKRLHILGHVKNDLMIAKISQSRYLDALIIEKVVARGMAVPQSAFDTAVWAGRYIECWRRVRINISEEITWHLIPRREVQLHLCGTTRAKKSNVNMALKDRFGKVGTKKEPNPVYGEYKMNAHTWDAFALAVTWLDLIRSRGLRNIQ